MRPTPRFVPLLLALGLLLALVATPAAARHDGACPDGQFDAVVPLFAELRVQSVLEAFDHIAAAGAREGALNRSRGVDVR